MPSSIGSLTDLTAVTAVSNNCCSSLCLFSPVFCSAAAPRPALRYCMPLLVKHDISSIHDDSFQNAKARDDLIAMYRKLYAGCVLVIAGYVVALLAVLPKCKRPVLELLTRVIPSAAQPRQWCLPSCPRKRWQHTHRLPCASWAPSSFTPFSSLVWMLTTNDND